MQYCHASRSAGFFSIDHRLVIVKLDNDCVIYLGETLITDLDFYDDILIIAETLEVL